MLKTRGMIDQHHAHRKTYNSMILQHIIHHHDTAAFNFDQNHAPLHDNLHHHSRKKQLLWWAAALTVKPKILTKSRQSLNDQVMSDNITDGV